MLPRPAEPPSALAAGLRRLFGPLRSLRAQIAFLFGGLTVASCSVAVLVLTGLMTDELERATARTLDGVAQRAAMTLANGLSQRLLEARVLAGSAPLWTDGLDSPAVRQALARAQAAQPHSAWIGVAEANGRVVAATGGILVGQSVAQRPWFVEGLRGPHVGDVHRALLLEKLLPRERDGEPLRFVDFSAPIVVGGRAVGVLGMHGTWSWAREVVTSLIPADADRTGLDVYIFDRAGQLLYSPRDEASGGAATLSADGLGLPRPATPGTTGQPARVLHWPDGQDCLTTVVMLPSTSIVTDLGWQVVARQPVGRAFARARTASEAAFGIGIGFACFAAWLAWLASGYISRPLVVLADAARGVQRRLPQARLPVLHHNREVESLSAALASMTRCLQATHQAAPIGLCQIDLGGAVIEANDRLGQLLGLPAAALPNRRLAEFIAERDQARLQTELSNLALGRSATVTLEASLHRPGGEPLPVVVSASRVSGIEDLADYCIVVVEDLSMRIAAEAADRASVAKTSFLSQVSHELRTPLNAVLGFSQLMRMDASETLSPTQAARVDAITGAGRHLLAMIDDLLDLTQIEGRRLALTLEPVLLSEIVEQAIALVAEPARAAAVTIVRRPPPAGRGDCVLADRVRLRQVAVNLLSNAVKYNRAGGTVVVAWGPDSDASRVTWRVTDTGRGMRAEELRELFQPFNRLGAAGSGIQGSGIGLVVTRKLVDLMAGSIHVESTAGVGSRFEVTLPLSDLVPARLAGASPAAVAPVGPAPTVARRRRLLYVEDNPVNVQLLVGAMALRPDIELQVATDGAEALAMAARAAPDVFLLDMQLGEMTGLELAAALRLVPGCAGVPLIAVSADAMPRTVAAARADGFQAYLTKPFQLAQLFACIDRALQPGAVQSQGRAAPASPDPA